MAALRPVGSEKERPMTPDEPQPTNADPTPQQRGALRAPSGFKRALATGVGEEPAPLANDTYAERRAAAIKGSAGLTRSRRHILRDVKAALLHNPVPVLGDARLLSLWQSGDAAAEEAKEEVVRRETREVDLPAETRLPIRVPDETARSRSVSAPVIKQARVRTLTVPKRRAPASPSVGERVVPAERRDAPVPVAPLPVWGTGDPKLQQARERQELKKQNIAKISYPAPPPVQKKEKKKVSNSRGIAGLFEGDEPVAGWHNEADDFAKHTVDHFASGVATVPAPGFMPLHERLGRMTKKKAAAIPREASPPVQEAPPASPPVAPPAAERQMVADIIQSLNDFLNAECKEHAFVDERIDLWSQSSDQSQAGSEAASSECEDDGSLLEAPCNAPQDLQLEDVNYDASDDVQTMLKEVPQPPSPCVDKASVSDAVRKAEADPLPKVKLTFRMPTKAAKPPVIGGR